MSNNKFHKILSDTITLPLLPASNFKETNTVYYAVLEKNYIPITSQIECIYKPDWITGYKFIKEGENENETNEKLKYYNKLVITSISDNETQKLRKDVMEFTVRNNVNSLIPINHIYAKVSQIPKEDINVNLEFIPTKQQEGYLNKDGGIISGDEQEIHIKYWATLNGIKQSNLTLTLNTKLLDKDKIKSLKVNSSDNTVELVYLIDKNIDVEKELTFDAIFKTQYNKANKQKTIIQKVNTYKITLEIDNPNHIVFNGDNRILTYKCTYTDGINNTPKDVKDYVQLEFSYIKDYNELKYSVIKTIYDTESNAFKTTIKVYENYTNEERRLNVKAVYTGSKKIENDSITLIQDESSNIKLQYYVEYLDRDKNKIEDPSTNGSYNVSAFGETIRLHYYGIIAIDGKNSVKITNVTNTKNNISTTYAIDALVDNVLYNDVTLNGDEYILDINFDRNERTSITKVIEFNMNNISSALCTLIQSALLIKLEVRSDKCTEIIGGIPEYNNIILTFRAYDNKKNITIEDINLYTITCNNNDVNLADIQYEIITYDNINYVVASNIRCKKVYDEKVDRTLTFTVKYNTKSDSLNIKLKQKSAIYDCEIRPDANHVSGLGTDNFKVISKGIIYDGLVFKNDVLDKDNDKKLENPIEKISIINDVNNPAKNPRIKNNITYANKTQSIIAVDALSGGNTINTMKDANFTINIEYKGVTHSCNIKQLYLQLYIDLYKNNSYSESAKLNNDNLYISPFINNILYYKCYLCEINMDGLLKKVDLLQYQIKGFSISANGAQFAVQGYVDENPTYNKDYTYTGKITIPKYIISYEVTYSFKYMQGYSNDKNAISNNLYLERTVYINKPQIKTCTADDSELLNGTYIQYRSNNNKDISYNDNKSILRIGTPTQGISSKGYEVTLYYRVVFKIDLQPDANYIYGNEYKTYIDLDKTHFISFVDPNDITVDKNEFENADEVKFNDSSYLKIKFNVNKNDGLTSRSINKSIKYQFIQDTEKHYGAFTNYSNSETNRIEIYQNGASLNLKAFFDDNNSGKITDSSSKITYSAYPHSNQNLHVRVLLNDELQPTYSNYFKFTSDSSTFQINDGILDSDLNTYKSEYNLDDLYIELDNKIYTLYYCYNGVEKDKTNDLKVIRTSFGRDEKCELKADISKTEIKSNGDTVKITFYLQYNNGEIIDLGEGAIGKFLYCLNQTSLTPGTNNFIVTYDSELKKYSFDYTIDENLTTEGKTYTFSIQFGDDDERHKKELICIQKTSSYELNATISPSSLSSLSPSNIIITCHVEKDNNGQIYQDVNPDNFSIIQTNENETVPILNALETKPSGLLQGEYGKEYPVPDNTTENSITYEFKCSYTLNNNEYAKDLSVTQSGSTFDVSIYDGETDQSKQNIVNILGETKTIKYCGLLSGEHILDSDEVTFSYDNKAYITSVSGPETKDDYITRNVTFGLNNSPTQISYTFTATYEGTEKSITLTQNSALFELYATAYYMRDSTKIEDDYELDLKYDDSGYLYIQYYAKLKGETEVDLNKSHYTVEYSVYDDGDMTYELPINFAFVDTTVDNVNNTIVNKYSFSKNNNDSYDYERYVNFKITFNYISSVDAVKVLVMQDSSYNIAMSPFDFLIFKYEFLSPGGYSTKDKDKMNNQFGHDLDTITHITTKTDALMPYKNIIIDASNNVNENYVFINNLTAGFSKTIGTGNTDYKDIILFGGDNISGEHESVYINLKNIINTINSYTDKKLQKKCRYIYIDLYGHWYGNMGNGRLQITYNTYNMKGTTPNLSLDDFIYSTTDTPVNSEVIIKSVVMDKGSISNSSPSKDHYTLLGRLTYDMKRQSGNLISKTLYGYTFDEPNAYINASIFDVSAEGKTYAKYYKLDRTFKDLNVTALIINGTVYQFFSNPLILSTKTINKEQITSNIKDEEVELKPFLYSYFHSLEKGMQYNEITSISINTSTTDHLICELVDGVFKIKMEETYVNHTYNWPTDSDKTIDIVINYSPILNINSTDNIKLIIRVIEEKYTQTT
ncbi:MAG: hypothetical protein [phage Lak_Megaphage_RVC_AP4_GC26]|uniref:Baseplate wedge initiator n=1 Tax=phage Lak_Megaphage_RVC_AP3_GC26 TaxID=3109225 RepID=A0ABZ0Z119_9CAUD|nr:MAG: hypothetical protein [phage Lak_Megaphage_RVC_AP3_GC26]WQJ52172.1 MAG: hypothetical protein [phage Lak_Megaphage_RVC_AP4_GC26]